MVVKAAFGPVAGRISCPDPHIGIALQDILGFSEREEQRVVDTLKDTLERSRKN